MDFWLKKLNISTITLYTFFSLFLVLLFVIPYSLGYYFLPLFLLAIAVSGLFILKDPRVGIFTIIIVTMIFERFFSLAPLIVFGKLVKIYLLDFVILATFFSWLYNLLQRKKHGQKGAPVFLFSDLTKSIIVFILILFFGFLRSIVDDDLDMGIAFATFKNFFYVAIYFLTVIIFNTREKIISLVKVIIYTGFALIPFIFYGFLTGYGLWSDLTPGVRLIASTHAEYLIFAVFLSLGWFLKGEKYFIKNKQTARLILLIVILIQIIGFIGGMFRHLWLGFLAALIVFFILLDKSMKFKLYKIFLAYLLIVLLVVSGWYWITTLISNPPVLADNFYIKSFLTRTKTLWYLEEETVEGSAGWRLAVSSQGLQEFIKSPFLGHGLAAKIRFSFRGWEEVVEARGMHNDLVGMLLQLGLLGVVVFMLILYFNFKNLWQVFRIRDQEFSYLTLGLISIFIVQIFAIIFSLYFSANMISLFFWLFLGIGQAMANQSKNI